MTMNATFHSGVLQGRMLPKKILLVDDSSTALLMMRMVLKKLGDVQILTAWDGAEAVDKAEAFGPDLILMDVNMPVMDGLTAIKHIMVKCPTPVVMFSTLTGQGATETFEALRYGAVDFLQKPSRLQKEDLKSQHELIISRVKNAARAGIDTIRYLRPAKVNDGQIIDDNRVCRRVFAIGSTYGSYGALLGLIPVIDSDLPAAFVSVLYATPSHVDAFSRYLGQYSRLTVCRAQDGMPLAAGHCYLASAFEEIALDKDSDVLSFRLKERNGTDPKQASDHLMTSLSEALQAQASAILLSGIGDDGVAGVGRILDGGGNAIVQDPKTCLCKDTTTAAIQRYGLPIIPPGRDMAKTVRSHCLAGA